MTEFVESGRKLIVTQDGREIGLEIRPGWRGALSVWDTRHDCERAEVGTLEEAREYIVARFWD